MIIVIIGPPASGKGTQAEKISKKFGMKHISTGDIFRRVDDKEISEYLVSGKLLPDELVFKYVKEEIDDVQSFILDGFPRNLNQAKMLDEFLKQKGKEIDHVIYLKVPDDVVIKRIVSRRICEKCGKNYNLLSNPPPKDNRCECGGKIIQREDDKKEVAETRLKIFKKITQPVLDYYIDKLIVVDGTKDVESVFKDICKMLNFN